MSAPSRRASVLVVAFSQLRSDARVLRQLRLLTPDYDVSTVGYGEAPDGVVSHVRIPDELVYWHKDRSLLLQRRYAAVWARNAVHRHLLGVLPRGTYDVVLANDADTVPLALALQPRGGVHADLHEYAPRQHEDSARWRYFVAPYYRWLVSRYVTACPSVTTVGQGLADQYAEEYGVHARVVVNAAPYHEASPGPVGEPLRLVHSGGAMRVRELERMIHGVEAASADVTLDLYLVPTDAAYHAELAELAAASRRVTLHEPVAADRLVETLAAYDVGVYVLPPSGFNAENALPNKVFDFVQARLGLVVGPSPEMARLVRDHGLGAVTDGFTSADLATTLAGITADDVRRWKAASHTAARELSAEHQTGAWAEMVGALADAARGGAAGAQ